MIQKKLRARCGKCETTWVVTELPKPVEEAAELMISASCPRCGENKEIYLASDKVNP